MKTFRDPSLMSCFSMLQISVGDPNVIEAQRQTPAFDVSAELRKLVSGYKVSFRMIEFGHE